MQSNGSHLEHVPHFKLAFSKIFHQILRIQRLDFNPECEEIRTAVFRTREALQRAIRMAN